MGQLSLRAVVGGVAVGLVVAIAGLIVLVVAVAAGRGLDITLARNAELAHRPSIQLPFLAVWVLALLAAGTTAGRMARGQALKLHGGVIAAIGLLAALSGMSRQDPAWATTLVLLSTVPVALAGAHIGPAPGRPGGPPAAFGRRWGLAIAVAVFCVATVTLAASEGGVLAWIGLAAGSLVLASAVRARVRGNVPA